MKANRKFIQSDDGVSPVIAVILMTAVTVVLSATVYTWVSGFGAAPQQPARSISLDGDGVVDAAGYKNYTVSSASGGLTWSKLILSLDGIAQPHNVTDASGASLEGSTCPSSASATITGFIACSGRTSTIEGLTGTVDGGDRIILKASGLSGKTLRILDAEANSVLLTLTVG